MRATMLRLANALIPFALFALAFAIRALPWGRVVRDEHVYLHGHDSFYHMRRVLYALANDHAALDFDPYIYYPHGARAIWPPFFDGLLGLVLAPFHDPADPRALELAAIWVPPALGAATVVALYLTARRHYGVAIATWAASILSVLSAHFWYSQLGYVDHHVAIALMAMGLFASTLELLTRDLSAGAALGPQLRASALCGGAIAAMLLLWPGGLLHVALCELCLLGFWLARPSRADALRFAACFALMHAFAAIVLSMFGAPNEPWAQWTPYSPVVLTRFQPWLLSSAAIVGVSAQLLWRRPGFPADGAVARGVTIAALSLVVAVVSALALPDFSHGLLDAWQWLSKSEVFQAGVRESQPLLQIGGRFSTRIAEVRLSYFIYLFPLAMVGLLLEARAPERRVAALTLLAWALPLALVTLAQRRFFNSFSIFLALGFGWTIVRTYAALARRLPANGATRAGLGLGLLALVLLLLSPMHDGYRELFAETRAQLAAADGEESLPHPWMPLLETADWLRENTPETRGYLDAALQPEYGVMAGVGVGHVVEYVGRRATVVNNFGDDLGPENLPLALAYYATPDEDEAIRILERLGVRFVLAEPSTPRGEAMMQRLFNRDGRGLTRHRMLYESPRVGRSRAPTALKVFERVPGARLVGRARPGASVKARLELETNLGRAMFYALETRASDDGRFELRLPYASHATPRSALRAASHYIVESDERRAQVAVAEADVTQGRTLDGPDLSP